MTGTAIRSAEEPDTRIAEARSAPSRIWPLVPVWARVATIIGIGALAIPFLAMLTMSLTQNWYPTADLALMELRTFDVGGPDTPLLGVYSRFNWYHLGPIPYWLLAGPYRLLGARPAGMLVGATLFNAAAVSACVALAWRRGGRGLALATALALALLINGVGGKFLVDWWNPYLPVFGIAVLILATWSVLEGDLHLLPVVIGVSCFAAQAHFIFVGLVGSLTALAVVGAVVHIGRDRRNRDFARYPTRSLLIVGATTAVTTALFLAPVVFEQLTNRPGNLVLILRSFVNETDRGIGLGWAIEILSQNLSPVGFWLVGEQQYPDGLNEGGPYRLAMPILALAAVTVLAVRARRWSAVRFLLVTSVSALASLVVVYRVSGFPYPYLTEWLRSVAVMLWLSVGWALVAVARTQRWMTRDRALWLAPVAAVIALLAITVTVARTMTSESLALPDEPASVMIEDIAPAMVEAVAGQPLVRLGSSGGWCAGEKAHGLALQLVEHGTEVAVDGRQFPLEYGQERTKRTAVPLVELICGPTAGERVAKTPVPPVGSSGLFDPPEMARFRAVKAEAQARIRDLGYPEEAEMIENPMIGATTILKVSRLPEDRALALRFDRFMRRALNGGAVYYWPDGVSHVAPA
jgi:hypothetical protein